MCAECSPFQTASMTDTFSTTSTTDVTDVRVPGLVLIPKQLLTVHSLDGFDNRHVFDHEDDGCDRRECLGFLVTPRFALTHVLDRFYDEDLLQGGYWDDRNHAHRNLAYRRNKNKRCY
jgi:hypothetical protein